MEYYKTINDIKMNYIDVLQIIQEINNNISLPLIAEYCLVYNIEENEVIRRSALYEYFLEGNCNIYVEILAKVFDGDIKYYVKKDGSHVVAGIGDFLYDVAGLISPHLYNEFIEYDLEGFQNISDWMGPHNDENIRIIEQGSEIGKNKIDKLLGINYSRIKKD